MPIANCEIAKSYRKFDLYGWRGIDDIRGFSLNYYRSGINAIHEHNC